MGRKLVLFGTGDMAQLAHYFFSEDTDYEIVAFTVDSEYYDQPEFCGLPVMKFEEIDRTYPPSQYDFFVALAYSKQNELRKEKYLEVKRIGYSFASYISPRATILNKRNIGENCFIFENNVIQPFTEIGNNVVLWSGNHIGHHTVIKDHVFIASHAVISGHVTIGEQCFIGVNATLRDDIKIGDRCVVGAGVLLLSDAEADGLYKGVATPRIDISNRTYVKI